jgi:choline dehydrogenase-like flavoprotein
MIPLTWSYACRFLILSFVHHAATSSLEYDYIIIGGGTCGLTIANRLSEVPYTRVAVVEAGASVINNENVTNVDDFTVALGTPIDWQYESTNQIYAAGQKIEYHSGKALGGSSTINGMF